MSTKRRAAPAPSSAGLALATSRSRAGIIDAAVRVFARKSFAATRVEDLIAEADVARRTFYKYFANKEQVLAAIFEFAGGELLRSMRAAQRPAPPGDSLEPVRRTLDLYLDYHLANPRLLAMIVQQAIDPASPLAAYRRRFRAELVELMDAAVRAGTGERNDPRLYAALVSALEGTSLDLAAEHADARAVAHARKVMHALLDRALARPKH